MKAKKYKQGLVTSLTALSTAMLCQTAATYASDIEIYKAPTTGGATLMLVLDMSSSMVQPVKNLNGGYENPINADYKITCSGGTAGNESNTNGNAYAKEQTFTFVDSENNSTSYTFSGRFCNVTKTDVDTWAAQTGTGSTAVANRTKATLIKRSCQLANTLYRCPDRLTSLKHSLFDLIIGTATNERLPSTASIGFRTFPTYIKQNPLVLTDPNRKTLLASIAGLTTANNTPISKAYSTGASDLFDHISTSEAACAGYGVYFLTDGEPVSDNTSDARNLINPYLSTGNKVTYCSGSWQCVAAFAQPLQQKKNTQNVEVKTAIVGFGKDFSFANKNDSTQSVEFDAKQIETYTDTWLGSQFSGNALEAAKAAVRGKGGWYSANSKEDIVSSVDDFVNSIKIPIPAITTGTSAIPQDALNTSVIQPYAYFPQFQPTPSEDYRTWTGNLKKYNVVGGVLKDKTNTALFSSAGVLNKTNEDLWTPNYAAGTTLTADQQSLKALGGLLSRLNLKKTGSNLNRKVFTNEGTTLTAIDETYIKASPKTRGYYLGLLGYNITVAQISALNSATDVDTLLTSSPELRKIGAVMHSTPVLLTQSGTVAENSDGSVNTVNRDDYLLFGTTQGVLHVVKAGKSNEISTVGNTAGEEVFAFVPQEMLSAQGKAFLDPPQTVDATNTNSNGMNNLYYGVDGAWTAHTEYVYNYTDEEFKVYDSSSKYGKQWVYGGLRMGGRSYYALDLTKIAESTSNQPKVKFRINPVAGSVDRYSDTGTAVTTPYSNLNKMGESWSKPTIANVQWKGKRRLVMFVGGGYDRGYETFNYDQDSVTQNTSTGRGSGIGAGVYMFDANTGELLWSTYDAVDEAATNASTTTPKTTHYIGNGDELKYSVVSQIKGVDRDGDGDVDHLYFGDLGGQVFRIDLDSKHTASDTSANYAKQITRIYNGHVANGYSPRFYEMPAFTVYSSTSGLFAVISIGSGNRSTPLLGKVVNATATNSGFITPNETATTNALLSKDAIYNIYDTAVTQQKPEAVTLGVSPIQSNLFSLMDSNRMLSTGTNTGEVANKPANVKGWYYAFTSSATVGDRKAVEKVQGDLIAIDNDLYVSTFDAEAVGTTESCGAGIYGASRAHRFCMPYGQCANGDTVANNTLNLGKGLLGITMGPGTSGADRRIITPLGSLPNGNKITGITYNAANKLIPQSWYEKN